MGAFSLIVVINLLNRDAGMTRKSSSRSSSSGSNSRSRSRSSKQKNKKKQSPSLSRKRAHIEKEKPEKSRRSSHHKDKHRQMSRSPDKREKDKKEDVKSKPAKMPKNDRSESSDPRQKRDGSKNKSSKSTGDGKKKESVEAVGGTQLENMNFGKNQYKQLYDCNLHIRVCLNADRIKKLKMPKANTLKQEKLSDADKTAGLHLDWLKKREHQKFRPLFDRHDLRTDDKEPRHNSKKEQLQLNERKGEQKGAEKEVKQVVRIDPSSFDEFYIDKKPDRNDGNQAGVRDRIGNSSRNPHSHKDASGNNEKISPATEAEAVDVDPKFVPSGGRYFLHDDRENYDYFGRRRNFRSPRNDRRGGGFSRNGPEFGNRPGPAPSRFLRKSSPDMWKHDKFGKESEEEGDEEQLHQREGFEPEEKPPNRFDDRRLGNRLDRVDRDKESHRTRKDLDAPDESYSGQQPFYAQVLDDKAVVRPHKSERSRSPRRDHPSSYNRNRRVPSPRQRPQRSNRSRSRSPYNQGPRRHQVSDYSKMNTARRAGSPNRRRRSKTKSKSTSAEDRAAKRDQSPIIRNDKTTSPSESKAKNVRNSIDIRDKNKETSPVRSNKDRRAKSPVPRKERSPIRKERSPIRRERSPARKKEMSSNGKYSESARRRRSTGRQARSPEQKRKSPPQRRRHSRDKSSSDSSSSSSSSSSRSRSHSSSRQPIQPVVSEKVQVSELVESKKAAPPSPVEQPPEREEEKVEDRTVASEPVQQEKSPEKAPKKSKQFTYLNDDDLIEQSRATLAAVDESGTTKALGNLDIDLLNKLTQDA